MRDILLALQAALADLPEVAEVAVIEDHRLPPPAVALPFIGLTDGPVSYGATADAADEEPGQVRLFVYAAASTTPGAALMDAQAGLLVLVDAIRARLNHHPLGELALPRLHVARKHASAYGLLDGQPVQVVQLDLAYWRLRAP